MSYDLTLVKKLQGEDWDTALDRMEENAALDTPLSQGMRQAWKTAANRILGIDPRFEFHDGPESLELIHDEYGMVVGMLESEAGVSVAYWHQGDDSDRVMRITGEVVDILKEASGWSVWDPQLGRELHTGAELMANGAGMMSDVAERLPGMVAASTRGSQSRPTPWWKFWAKKDR